MAQTRNNSPKLPNFGYLTSWKEIAEYMRAGVRTVQRYERELGLPVRRPTRKTRGAVMATRAELDAWVAATPIHKTFALSRSAANNPAIAYGAKIERNIAAMGRLRDQMLQLRRETRAATDLLLQRVSRLHTVMPPSRPEGYEPLIGMDWPLIMDEEDEKKEFRRLKTHGTQSTPQNKRPH